MKNQNYNMELKGDILSKIKFIKNLNVKELILQKYTYIPWYKYSDLFKESFNDDLLKSEFLLKLGPDRLNIIYNECLNTIKNLNIPSPHNIALAEGAILSLIAQGDKIYKQTNESMLIFNRTKKK